MSGRESEKPEAQQYWRFLMRLDPLARIRAFKTSGGCGLGARSVETVAERRWRRAATLMALVGVVLCGEWAATTVIDGHWPARLLVVPVGYWFAQRARELLTRPSGFSPQRGHDGNGPLSGT